MILLYLLVIAGMVIFTVRTIALPVLIRTRARMLIDAAEQAHKHTLELMREERAAIPLSDSAMAVKLAEAEAARARAEADAARAAERAKAAELRLHEYMDRRKK